MKRKDWKTKNLNVGIYGKNKKRRYFTREKILFLRKLFLRRNKFLARKNLVFNYFFYRLLLNSFKSKKQNYIYNVFLKNNHKLKSFFPEFSINKNVFNSKPKFKSLSKKYNFNYIFSSNNLNNGEFGLNYYTKVLDEKNFVNFLKDLNEDSNKNLIQFKQLDQEYNQKTNLELNNHFNFNINIMCILEIYKILIVLYIKKLIKKYI